MNAQEITLPSEDTILAYTHSTRMSVVNSLMAKTDDPKLLKILVSALKDMDSQALGRKRLKVEANANAIHAQAAAVIAQVLLDKGVRDSNAKGLAFAGQYNAPKLPTHIEDPITVPGEMSIAPEQLTYKAFMASFEEDE